jgi:hypothetical protein
MLRECADVALESSPTPACTIPFSRAVASKLSHAHGRHMPSQLAAEHTCCPCTHPTTSKCERKLQGRGEERGASWWGTLQGDAHSRHPLTRTHAPSHPPPPTFHRLPPPPHLTDACWTMRWAAAVGRRRPGVCQPAWAHPPGGLLPPRIPHRTRRRCRYPPAGTRPRLRAWPALRQRCPPGWTRASRLRSHPRPGPSGPPQWGVAWGRWPLARTQSRGGRGTWPRGTQGCRRGCCWRRGPRPPLPPAPPCEVCPWPLGWPVLVGGGRGVEQLRCGLWESSS